MANSTVENIIMNKTKLSKLEWPTILEHMTLKAFLSFIIMMEFPANLMSLIFGPDCFLTSDCLILLILKFILLLFFLNDFESSVLTVIVFLSKLYSPSC